MSNNGELERLNFFPGFFTTADDWTAEQKYHLRKWKLHNRSFHTPGIADGLEVTPHPDGGLNVLVTTGVALDKEGNLIYLPKDTKVSLEPPSNVKRVAYVLIEFDEILDDYVANIQDPDYSGHTRIAERSTLQATEAGPTGKKLELARITLEANALTINPQDIDRNHVDYAGSIGVAPPRLPADLQTRISSLMRATRENFAKVAIRFPSPSVGDVRTAALQLQLAVAILQPAQLRGLLQAIANVQLDVQHELAQAYPPLVCQPEFRAYQDAVAGLLEALRAGREPEVLLNHVEQVSLAALQLAEVTLQPPVADAGPDQTVLTLEPEIEVTLDASGSRAADGHQIVRYIWENVSAHRPLVESADPVVKVTLPLGVHLLRLVVEDNTKLRSEPDTVVITVAPSQIAGHSINPNEGRRGATFEAVIFGVNLHYVTAVNVYAGPDEDTRVKVTIQSGATSEQLPVLVEIGAHAALGPRTFELVTPYSRPVVAFTVVPHEAPVILGIAPAAVAPSPIHPIPVRIEGEALEQARKVTFLLDDVEDAGIHAIIRRANAEYMDVDLTISANAPFGRRRFSVTTPAGTTESPPNVTLTVLPGYLSGAIVALTVLTALIHLFLDFPNPLFILNGLGYLALLAGLYAPSRWLFTGLRPMLRWVLVFYALVTIVAWLAMGDRSGLAYVTKAVEALLVLLLVVESRRR